MATTLPTSFAYQGAEGPTKELGEHFNTADANLLMANANTLLTAVKDLYTQLAGVGGPVTRTFSPVLLFDVPEQFMSVTQSGPLAFTLAASGHLANTAATVLVKTDGNPVTFDEGKLLVSGYADTSQYLLLSFYNATADLSVRTVVSVSTVPKFGVPTVVGAPTNFQASLTQNGAPSLTWTAATNATSYVVERATNSAFSVGLAAVYSGSGTSFTDSTVAASTSYYYRVKALRAGSTDSAYVALSGAIQSGAPSAPAKYYNLAGAAQNIAVASPQDFAFTTQAFTSLFWLKLPALGNYFTMGRCNGSQRGWDFVVKNATQDNGSSIGVAFFDAASNGNSYAYYETANIAAIAAGNFVRVGISHDGVGGVKIYVNGALVTAQFFAGPQGFASTIAGGTFGIGAYPASTTYKQSNGALLDTVAFANRVLTQTEITEDWNSGVRSTMIGTSFESSLIASWPFNNDLLDEIGIHHGTATTPLYVAYS